MLHRTMFSNVQQCPWGGVPSVCSPVHMGKLPSEGAGDHITRVSGDKPLYINRAAKLVPYAALVWGSQV